MKGHSGDINKTETSFCSNQSRINQKSFATVFQTKGCIANLLNFHKNFFSLFFQLSDSKAKTSMIT